MQSRRSIAAFWIVVAMMLVTVASSAVPSPIYPVYAAEWHLSPLMLTAVFAIYVAGLLASLLTAGSLSDHIGRRPVLVAGIGGIVVAMVLFSLADGVGALIVARIVQGLAVGVLLGTLGATLLDHSLESRPALAGVLNGVVPPIALAVGAITSGAFVEWGPMPEQLVYLVYGGVLLLAIAAIAVIPRRTGRPGALRSLVPTIGLAPASRPVFRSVAGGLIGSWALGGLYLSLVPSVLGKVFGITDHFAAGTLIAVFTGAGALTGLAIQRLDARIGLIVGLVALVLGPIVTVSFVVAGSLGGTVAGTVVAGIGFGAGFQAALRMLLTTATADNRAGLLATIYVVSYLAFGVPSVVAGIFEPALGLVPVIVGYGAFVVLAAAVALVMQLVSTRAASIEESAAEVLECTATGSLRTVTD
jgi:predicted MFS family arabinose efflux permease